LCAARLVVGSAAVVGRALLAGGVDIFLPFPPPLAEWLPHVGPGTPVAVVVAILVATWGCALTRRLSWWPLLASAYGAAVAWMLELALVDGWQRGSYRPATRSRGLRGPGRTPPCSGQS
jgi:methylthioxylose transferase